MTNTQEKITYIKNTHNEYLADRSFISASDIKTFLKSPKNYYFEKYLKKHKRQDDSKSHLSLGSAIHEMILEPHQFRLNFIIAPKFNKRTKAGKEEYNAFMLENANKIIISDKDMAIVQAIAEESIKNQTLVDIVQDSYRELSCYTVDEKTGLKIKVRPDVLSKKRSAILDVKSCIDASYKKFRSSVFKFGYYISAPFYMDFLNRENYIFAAVEKNPPYQIALYSLDDEIIEKGRKEIRIALDLLKWCYDNNYWPDYIEFSILKEHYELGTLENFFDTVKRSEKIMIIRD